MKHNPPIPEQTRQAYVLLLQRVFVTVRNRSRGTNRFSYDQLFDLMDAVHNVPQFLGEKNDFFTDETIRKIYLEPYDRKWATTTNFSLIKTLDEALTPYKPHTPPPPPTRRRTLYSVLRRLWPRRPKP